MKISKSKHGWKIVNSSEQSGIRLDVLAFKCGYRIDALSDTLGCSARHLLNIFKRDLGLRAKEWMRQERTAVAQQMLANGKTPGEIAKLLGFNSAHNFRRDFMELSGDASEYPEIQSRAAELIFSEKVIG